jgi:hypothetical protein
MKPEAAVSVVMPAREKSLEYEMDRQDALHPDGYPPTRDGIRLAIATAKDELEEALGAWRAGRCKCPQPRCQHHDWSGVAEEMLQAAAVIMRAVRSLRQGGARPKGPVPPVPGELLLDGWVRASDWTYQKGRWVIAQSYGPGYDLWEDGHPSDGESFRKGSRYYGHFALPEDAVHAQQREARAMG